MSLSSRLFTGLAAPLLKRFLGDSIIWYPAGDLNSGITLTGVLVALDAELGTNESPGDGAITRDVHGDRERRTGRIELDASLAISETDLWSIDGEIWTTQRQDARDNGPNAGFQGWRITTKKGRRTQHSLLKETRPVQKG